MATTRHYVTNTIVPRLLRHLRQRGVDPAQVMADLALPPDAEARSEMRVHVDVLVGLAEQVSGLLHDGNLGLHLAQGVNPGDYGLIDFVVRSSPTMRDALAQTVRYMGLVDDAIVCRVAEVRGDAVFEFTSTMRQDLGWHINSYILVVMMHLGRKHLEAPWPVKAVWFANPCPPGCKQTAAFLGVDTLEFNARSTGVRFDARLLETRMPGADLPLHTFLENQAKQRMQTVPQPASTSFAQRVRQELAARMPSGNIQVERVATALHCSARTMQRRLTADGTSFQDVLDDVRHEQALILLQTHRKSVAEVAFTLGYSDLAPFVRAFRRWTGRTPGAARG